MPGVSVPRPEGAFYVFPRIEGLTDSFEFCRQMLLETRVGIAPGSAFGAGGEGSVRLCYASEQSVLERAFDRMEPFVHRWYNARGAGTIAISLVSKAPCLPEFVQSCACLPCMPVWQMSRRQK